MNQFLIKNFAGQNNLGAETTIQPNEFYYLKNLSTKKGAACGFNAENGGTTMPTPLRVQGETDLWSFTGTEVVVGSFSANIPYGVFCSGKSLSAYEMVTLLMPVCAGSAGLCQLQVYSNNSGVPGSALSAAVGSRVVFDADPAGKPVWRAVWAMTEHAVTDYWLVFSFSVNVDVLCKTQSHSWKQYDPHWEAPDLGVGDRLPAHVISTSQLSGYDHLFPITLPYDTVPAEVTKSSINWKIDSFRWTKNFGLVLKHGTNYYINMGGYEIDDAHNVGRINCGGTTFSGETLYPVSDVNIVVNDGIIAFTYPGTPCCVPIGYVEPSFPSYAAAGTQSGAFANNRVSCEVFQNNIVLGIPGPHYHADRWHPCYFLLTSAAGSNNKDRIMPFDSACGCAPLFAKTLANTLVFLNYNEGSHEQTLKNHRLCYSAPGELDSFDHGVDFENIFMGSPIIDCFSCANQLVVSSNDEVKVLAGVVGSSAVLSKSSLPPFYAHVKISSGNIMLLTRKGLVIYNGSYKILPDNLNIIKDFKYSSFMQGAELLYDDFHKVVVIKTGQGFAPYAFDCDVGSFFMYDYYDSSNIKNGTFEGQQRIFVNSTEGIQLINGGGNYKGVVAESGWIDVDPEIENKAFQFTSVEFSTTNTSTFVNLYVYLERGETYSFPNIDLNQPGSYYRVHKRTDGQGKRIKYKITSSNNTTGQIVIHGVTFYYNPAKGRG